MKRQTDTGVLVYGFNNGGFDYVKMAVQCAERVRKYWHLPATVVTDTPFSHDFVDCLVQPAKSVTTRLYSSLGRRLPFLNSNRSSSLTTTPYQTTYVIDADFFVGTSQVPDCASQFPLQVSKDYYSLTGSYLPKELFAFQPCGLELHLATILRFSKSAETHLFFKYWAKATEFYPAYSRVYGFDTQLYRNDYCVSIALDLLNQDLGSTSEFTLPYTIPTVSFAAKVLSLDPLVLSYEGTVQEYVRSDVHFLNKDGLTDLASHDPSFCLRSSDVCVRV